MRRLVFGLSAFAACAFLTDAPAQQAPPPGLPSPRVNTVFPAGMKAGTAAKSYQLFGADVHSNTVTVTGFDLDEPTGLLFSHPGIKAEYVAPKEPAADPKKKDPPPAMGKKAAPSGPAKFKVSVAADVPPGTYDVRVVCKWGVSNPRAFVVGQFREVAEAEPNNDVPEAQRVEVGTTVNGVIASGTDVDYTVFAGKKGQRVVIHAAAGSVDSRAKPLIEVIDAAGRKVTQNRNYKDTDAVVDLTVPADGDYYIRLSEFTYQTGSPDHTYRLTISSAPWVDAVYPPMVEPGKPAQVTLYGRNLPGGKPATGFAVDGGTLETLAVTITPPADKQALAVRDRVDPIGGLQDGFEYRLKGPGGLSNAVPVYFAKEKVVVKKNTGGTKPDTAEPLPVPCELAGMIHRKNDRDWYKVEGKKGDVLMVELSAERVGSPADFFFTIHNPAQKNADISGEQDDDPDSLHPFAFFSRGTDPGVYKFTVPQDGPYLIAVGCRDAGYLTGPRTIYRLRVGPAKPDFRAVVMPYSRYFQTGSAARQDGTEALDVFVHRIDGFTGPVTVTADGLPAGVTAKPVTIGPAARWGVLVLTVKPDAKAWTGPIKVTAKADVAGKPQTREARPASVTWGTPPQQNVPVIARLDQSLVLAVRPEKGFFKLAADTANAVVKVNNKDEKRPAPLTVKQGEKLTLPVKVSWISPEKQNVTVAAEPMVPGNPAQAPIGVQPGTQPTKDKPEGAVTVDVKANAPPGTYTIQLRGDAQVPFSKQPGGKGANVPMTTFADPVEVTVLPTTLAKVTVSPPPNNAVKLGQTAELTVKVDRQYDYAGPFTVTVELPKGTAGVTVADVTIPAGKDEAKLVLQAAADSKPGAVNNAVVTVRAAYRKDHTVSHEVKVNFNVAK